MTYMLFRIFGYLIIAALLGLVMGWLMRGKSCRIKEKKMQAEYKLSQSTLKKAKEMIRQRDLQRLAMAGSMATEHTPYAAMATSFAERSVEPPASFIHARTFKQGAMPSLSLEPLEQNLDVDEAFNDESELAVNDPLIAGEQAEQAEQAERDKYSIVLTPDELEDSDAPIAGFSKPVDFAPEDDSNAKEMVADKSPAWQSYLYDLVEGKPHESLTPQDADQSGDLVDRPIESAFDYDHWDTDLQSQDESALASDEGKEDGTSSISLDELDNMIKAQREELEASKEEQSLQKISEKVETAPSSRLTATGLEAMRAFGLVKSEKKEASNSSDESAKRDSEPSENNVFPLDRSQAEEDAPISENSSFDPDEYLINKPEVGESGQQHEQNASENSVYVFDDDRTEISPVRVLEVSDEDSDTEKPAVQDLQKEKSPWFVDYEILSIDAIPQGYRNRLKAEGVESSMQLLYRANTRSGLDNLSNELGVSKETTSEWVAIADLLRVPGIGFSAATLLQKAGISSAPRLSRQNAVELEKILSDLNQSMQLLKNDPDKKSILEWIEKAAWLPAKIEE